MTWLAVLTNRWVQLAAGVVLAIGLGFGLGHHQKTLEDASDSLKSAEKAVHAVSASAAATSHVDQTAASSMAATAAATLSNVKTVRLYVPPAADARCIVSTGAVRLLDAAARDTVPGPSVSVPDADSGVALSELVADDVANAGSFHQLAERLKAWDDWYDAQKAVFDAR